MMGMSIDVLLVSYNQCNYIAQALESIFMQKVLAKVRIVVADDASTDGTMGIIKMKAEQSPFELVYLSNNSNLGISKNYQRAFAVCSGDYVAVLEGDDYWNSSHHLQQHIDFLEKHRECSMSMNAITCLDENSGTFSRNKWNYSQSPYFVNVKEQIEKGNQLGNLSSCVMRTSCVKKLPSGLFDLPIADWMLGVMMAQWGTIGLLRESTSVYRVKASGVWAGRSRWQQHLVMLRDADMYDKFQEGKYHKEWKRFKHNCWIDVRRNWMHYLPVFVQKHYRRIKKKCKNGTIDDEKVAE